MKMKNDSLEKKRPLLLTAGFMFAVSLALVSFEWRTPYYGDAAPPPKPEDDTYVYETPPITIREVEEKKEMPEPPKLETDQFDVVEKIEPDVEEAKVADTNPDPIELPPDPTFAPVEEEKEVEDNTVFKIAETMPEYPGGDGRLLGFLASNTVFPQVAIDNNITGTVWVNYVVNKKGKVTRVKVVRGAHPILDKEAVRVVKSLKGYKPGKQRGRPVNVEFTVPIRFELR